MCNLESQRGPMIVRIVDSTLKTIFWTNVVTQIHIHSQSEEEAVIMSGETTRILRRHVKKNATTVPPT